MNLRNDVTLRFIDIKKKEVQLCLLFLKEKYNFLQNK